jgi:hypothetical protein
MEKHYITFQQAKWFKEKGMDNWDEFLQLVNIPEQWQVIEWLRINHSIWVSVEGGISGTCWYAKLSVCSEEVWEDLDKRHDILSAHRKFNNEHKSPQEAYSAAFDYIKDSNLIKR